MRQLGRQDARALIVHYACQVTNNDVLRSLRYALELDNATLVDYFALADVEMPLTFLASLLKKDDEPGFEPLTDELLGLLFDGFIAKLRGPRADPVVAHAPEDRALGRSPADLRSRAEAPRASTTARAAAPERVSEAPGALTNNRILRSLRIGLGLKDTDVVSIMQLAGVTVSKSELGALFRREDHRNYQPCGDQFLRNFLRGTGLWHRQGRRFT